jgi:hypothetical protein
MMAYGFESAMLGQFVLDGLVKTETHDMEIARRRGRSSGSRSPRRGGRRPRNEKHRLEGRGPSVLALSSADRRLGPPSA